MKKKISNIKINNRLRNAKQDKVESLAKSIKEIGLLQPISIDNENNLISGLHRLEACKLLNQTEIECNVLTFENSTLKQLAEIDENLIRNDLTVLEKGDWLQKRKEIYERLYPETKAKIGKELIAKRWDTTAESATVSKQSFVNNTSQKLDKSERRIREDIQISKNIIPEVKQKIYGTELENQKTNLLELARLEPEKQKQIIEKITPEKNVKEVIAEIKTEEKQRMLEHKKAENLTIHKAEIKENKPEIKVMDCIDYLNTFKDDSIDLLITDPPYSTDIDDIKEFTSWVHLAIQKVKRAGRIYITIGAYPIEIQSYLDEILKQEKFILDNPLIWSYKNTLGVTPKMKYNLNYQMILHLYSDKSNELDTSVTNEMFSVMEINAPDGRLGNRFHTWQKPDELALRLIKHSTKENDLVVDCFACTGTFLVMAAKMGRIAKGCDISRENLNIAKERGCTIIG